MNNNFMVYYNIELWQREIEKYTSLYYENIIIISITILFRNNRNWFSLFTIQKL